MTTKMGLFLMILGLFFENLTPVRATLKNGVVFNDFGG
jgi:hypothetical protein